ncbi:restriction system protein [Pseudomonas delhiensis]|uniref:Restriction system protein n=1 Tax=Pseudomonas delhiensis TaxID=366289 RepID=A0A239KY71_9PSED|nr:restriction system protein [Pseudomonas delhiensis]SNT22204.1 hypothetical protein SAMN06295949_117113 [Pseudomonas delhiensis]
MARMWMVRGEGGSLYEAFREHGIAAIGWQQISAQAKPGIARKQLIALYQSAEPQMKQGSVISGASQVWRFVNEIQDGDTRAVFGDYVSIYDIQDAVDDGATVPIYYESRLAKLEPRSTRSMPRWMRSSKTRKTSLPARRPRVIGQR